MPKIIKREEGHLRPPAQHTCGRCKSVVEFYSEDIRHDSRDGDYCACPVCGFCINVVVLWPRSRVG